jgi:hypothetical protein
MKKFLLNVLLGLLCIGLISCLIQLIKLIASNPTKGLFGSV